MNDYGRKWPFALPETVIGFITVVGATALASSAGTVYGLVAIAVGALVNWTVARRRNKRKDRQSD